MAMAFLVPSGRVVTSSCLTYCERASGLSVSIECIAVDDKQYRMARTYQTLGVLTDNDKVDGVRESGGRYDRLDRSDVCVKVQALAEADNGTAVALGGGGRGAGW